MFNPFADQKTDVETERELVTSAQRGDRRAMEKLIRLHQPWVFNIVLRMLSDFHEAEDACQEIIIKTFAKLSTFRGKSRFRTWLYRIAVNHVLNVKKTKKEAALRLNQRRWANDAFAEKYLDQEPADGKREAHPRRTGRHRAGGDDQMHARHASLP